MNGISPFWSFRTFIASVVVPPLSGFVYWQLVEIRHVLTVHPFAYVTPTFLLVEGPLFGALLGGIFGYPFTILVVGPAYGFILTRMRRVTFGHFLLLWLVMSALWLLLLTAGSGDPTVTNPDSGAGSNVDDIIDLIFKFCAPTWIAVIIFYLIVRRPVAAEAD